MDQTLIPFAMRSADNEIVGVADVPSGLSCGCICPSCSTALIARKGDVKIWHFAHQGRAEESTTQTRCDFSWDVSVRLMARQLLQGPTRMCLPPCHGELFDSVPGARGQGHGAFAVAPARTIEPISCSVDVPFAGALVDVLMETAEAPFIVYFTYDGRLVPDVLKAPMVPCAGVLAISIPALAPRFVTQMGDARTPRQILADLLADDISSKRWIYHPDYARAQELARAEFAEQIARRPAVRPMTYPMRGRTPPTPQAKVPYTLITPTPGEKPLFHCVNCEFKWGQSMGGMDLCPQCGSIFMIVRIREHRSP